MAGKKKTPFDPYGALKKKLGSYGLYDIFIFSGLIFASYQGIVHPQAAAKVLGFFFALLPFVLPFLLWNLLKYSWFMYIREDKHFNRREYVVLEIQLPEEVTQSPYAMELVIRSMYQTGEIDTPRDWYVKGQTKPWFSLEIASNEGQVRFYVWVWKHYKNFIESQFYAHYPGIQIHEVPDYTLALPLDLEKMDIWGIEQKLQKPDPYPIVTYVEAGLDDRAMKEEYKHDPLASLLEFFGSIGPGEYLWMQIIIRAHGDKMNDKAICPYSAEEKAFHGHAVPIHVWAEHEIKTMLAKTVVKEGDKPNFMALSEGDKNAVKAIELKLNKQCFDTGIRIVYAAKKENLVNGRKTGLPTVMRAFEHGSEGRGLNGFKPLFKIAPFDYPWQDYFGMRKRKKKIELYEGYTRRQIFFPPMGEHYIVLNTEELASIYHFPGQVARTPTLGRMGSKRGEAPSNLPV